MRKWSAVDVPSQEGKLAILTGANSGIGFHAARELARAGCTIILACRVAEKAAAARQAIANEIPGARLEDAVLNLADLASIRSFATSFVSSGRRLDLLINNAGVMALPTRKTTANGFELQFGTNHLGHFALTGLLLFPLLAAPAARVVTVSSIAHRGGKIRFDDLQSQQSYDPWKAYRQSKLANLLFGYELERRFEVAGVTPRSIIVHPGVANTNLFTSGPGSAKGLLNSIIPKLISIVGQSEQQGALTTLYGATEPSAAGGHFYGPDGFRQMKGHPIEVAPEKGADNRQTAARLWSLSEELTSVHYVFPKLQGFGVRGT